MVPKDFHLPIDIMNVVANKMLESTSPPPPVPPLFPGQIIWDDLKNWFVGGGKWKTCRRTLVSSVHKVSSKICELNFHQIQNSSLDPILNHSMPCRSPFRQRRCGRGWHQNASLLLVW